jgi:hypothetical protein
MAEYNDGATVLIDILGKMVPVCAGHNGFRTRFSPMYTSSDCTGTAYAAPTNGSVSFDQSPSALFAPSLIGNIQGQMILYTPDYDLGEQTIQLNSYRDWTDGSCSINWYTTANVLPLIQQKNLTSEYAAPLSIKSFVD